MGLAWDTAVFRAIHLGLHHPWLDPIMRCLSDPGRLKIPILVLLGLLLLTRGRRGVVGVLVLALTLTATDQLSSKVLKPIFKRARPSVVLVDARPFFGIRRSNSFPSGHATNTFAAAPVVACIVPQAAVVAYVLAGTISLSRVYVGDHWPSDVVGGAILGFTFGFFGRIALGRLLLTLPWTRSRAEELPSGGPSPQRRVGGSRTRRAGTRYTRARS
jgi:undecaprenyl-diphosphatase